MEQLRDKRVLSGRRGSLPADTMLNFSRSILDMEEASSYVDYLQKNREKLEKEIMTSIILPMIDQDSFILKELLGESKDNEKLLKEIIEGRVSSGDVIQVETRLFQDVKYLVFIPLPIFDKEEGRQSYTVLGSKWRLNDQASGSICMLLFSMYIYFQAQHERGEHQKMYFSMLSLMISVIDAKDPVTAGHSQRVADISKEIGLWLKLGRAQQHDLEFTALLHDIGKISVSDYVLNKPSVYTQKDFEQMKHHTVRGAEMLAEVGVSPEIIDGVRHHHERVDGKGYPDGLTGDQMSLFAKIIKIADVFDALTSKRQYKEAWKIDKALDIIYRGRGTEFDIEIADAFIEHMRPEGWQPPVLGQNKNLKKQGPEIQKIINITEDFYRRYHDYISVGYPIPSRKAEEVAWDQKNGFMSFDWGETFNHAAFLENKPVILSYEKETQSLFFGQCCKAPGVMDIYYYFFRGFLNMGIYLLSDRGMEQALMQLTECLGEPVEVDYNICVFVGKKYKVVRYHTYDDKELLFYISDYMSSHYVYES